MSIGIVVVLSGCQGQGSQVTFTAGDISGDIPVPVYPGALQSTESAEISLPEDITPGVVTTDLKRYLTDDSADQVLEWYAQSLVDAGFNYQGVRDSGAVFFMTANWRYGLVVTTIQGQTNIIIAAGHE
ncbi:MAG TPA: hypothetical protein G4O08_04295 [Anaerolineae bacterium]|nr:hypothetical protein [Anaerolineae bacterium]